MSAVDLALIVRCCVYMQCADAHFCCGPNAHLEIVSVLATRWRSSLRRDVHSAHRLCFQCVVKEGVPPACNGVVFTVPGLC